ncbi:MAG: Ig-like domain-containing protein, partial [Planctomycetota bacterium]
MSLKSISLAAVLAGAMFLVGCGGGDSGPSNSPPQAILPTGAPFNIAGGATPYTIQLGGIDYDGNPLIYLFDSISSQGGTVAAASGGPPDVEYTPEPVWLGAGGGVDSFTFSVSDGFITSNTVMVYIGVDNDAPVAISQPSVAATEDTSLPITLTGSDPDGDAMTYHIVTRPSYGVLLEVPPPGAATLPFEVSPNVTYVPNLNENNTTIGLDSFTFTVYDHVLWSVASATVTIDLAPVNDAPVANTDVPPGIAFGLPLVIDVLNNDTDVENDNLSIVLAGFTQGGHGTVTHNATNDTFIYMPDVNFFGTDTFTYQITDDGVPPLTATGTVTITVNRPRCDVYGWGANANGELGVGDELTKDVPTRVLNITRGWDITGGEFFTIFSDVEFWTTGDNTEGQLADPNEPARSEPLVPPQLVGSDIEAGHTHGVCVTGTAPNSWVLAWGLNNEGQLGRGHTNDANDTILRVQTVGPPVADLKGATAVAAGSAHSLAVTFHPRGSTYLTDDEWRVYAWGANDRGQLGLGDTDPQLHATEITDLRDANFLPFGLIGSNGGNHIVDVVAFSDHSLALDDVGNVYMWGSNNECESGLSNATPTVLAPRYEASGYKQIAAGHQFSLALTTGGVLHGWGTCQNGEIGHFPAHVPRHPAPTYVPVPGDEVLHMAAGRNHALAAAREVVTLSVSQSGPVSDIGGGTFEVTVAPASLGATQYWIRGYVTHVSGEVGFIIDQIDNDTVRIVDAGIS